MLQIEAKLLALADAKHIDEVELAHMEADSLLIAALRQCWASAGQDSVEGVIKAYEAVPKWYT